MGKTPKQSNKQKTTKIYRIMKYFMCIVKRYEVSDMHLKKCCKHLTFSCYIQKKHSPETVGGNLKHFYSLFTYTCL